MGTFHTIATVGSLAVVAYIVFYVAYCYMTAPATVTVNALKAGDPTITRPATMMDKFAYATKTSATLFVQLVTAATVMLGNGILNMADFFGAPEVREWVQHNLSPEIASGVLMVLMAINVWARTRNSLGK